MKSLDEYESWELVAELERRQILAEQGRCDYCGRDKTSNPCRFSCRHNSSKLPPPFNPPHFLYYDNEL